MAKCKSCGGSYQSTDMEVRCDYCGAYNKPKAKEPTNKSTNKSETTYVYHDTVTNITVGGNGSVVVGCGNVTINNTFQSGRYRTGAAGVAGGSTSAACYTGNNQNIGTVENKAITGNNNKIDYAVGCTITGNNNTIRHGVSCRITGNSNTLIKDIGCTMTGNNNRRGGK